MLSVVMLSEVAVIREAYMNYLAHIIFILFLLPASFAQEIAITIDDAPLRDTPLFISPERTELLIDGLLEANVPDALIFVNTKKVDQNSAAQLQAYADAGFHIANHSHSHFSANSEDINVYLEDITKAHNILSNFDNVLPYYRYPFLHQGSDRITRDTIREHLQQLNYEIAYVTVDNYEWYMDALLQTALVNGKEIDFDILKDLYVSTMWKSIVFYDTIAKETLGRSPKHVLLLHETDITTLFITDLVAHLRAQGWKIISPQEAFTDPIASNIPDVLFNQQGRIAAIAHAHGWETERLRHESESQDYLDALFESRNVFQ